MSKGLKWGKPVITWRNWKLPIPLLLYSFIYPFALDHGCWAQGQQGEVDLALPKGVIVRARRQEFIMRPEIYTDFLGRREWWAGKASWRRISLRFDLRRIWASEEAEMVPLYWENNVCKGLGVMCSFIHWLYPFVQEICTEYQSCVCTMHRGYRVNSYGAYVLMECFSQVRLSSAVVARSRPNLSGLQKWRFIFHSCYMFSAGGRETRDGGTVSWFLNFLLQSGKCLFHAHSTNWITWPSLTSMG